MNKLINPLTKATYEKMVSDWLGLVNRRESGSVINLTRREQPYRVNQLLNDQKMVKKYLKNYSQTIILPVDLYGLLIEDSHDLNNYLKKIGRSKKRLCLFILNADLLLSERFSLLPYLNQLAQQNKKYSLIYFFQNNITLPSVSKRLSSFSSIYQNLAYHSYYQKEDQVWFLHYLENKFTVKLNPSLIEEIIKECGGHFWLIKEAVRQYQKTKNVKNIFNHQEMLIKLRIIVSEFEPVEKQLLIKIIKKDFNFNQEETDVIDYFLKINLVKKINSHYLMTIPLLADYLSLQTAKKTKISLNSRNQLVINDLISDTIFPKKEKKLLKCLLLNKNQVISREKAAKNIWGENFLDYYTDWALDQLIKRLRNKLINLGISKDLIKTIKNQGFIIS